MKSLIEDDKLFIENGPTNIIAEVFSSEKKEIYDLICEYSSKFLKDLSLEIETLKKPTSQKNKFISDIANTMFESTKLFLPNFIFCSYNLRLSIHRISDPTRKAVQNSQLLIAT